jgi:hypothetical protein
MRTLTLFFSLFFILLSFQISYAAKDFFGIVKASSYNFFSKGYVEDSLMIGVDEEGHALMQFNVDDLKSRVYLIDFERDQLIEKLLKAKEWTLISKEKNIKTEKFLWCNVFAGSEKNSISSVFYARGNDEYGVLLQLTDMDTGQNSEFLVHTENIDKFIELLNRVPEMHHKLLKNIKKSDELLK